MRFNQKRISSLISLFVGFYLISINSIVFAREVEQAMQWNMITEKNVYAPGEPVLLSIQMTNPSNQNAEVWFGSDGLEAFSFEIRNEKGDTLRQGIKIKRPGLTRSGFITIPAGKSRAKHLVLNQWCSTLLPHGRYTVVCSIEPYYVPKNKPTDDGPPVAQPLPIINLECSLELAVVDVATLNQLLSNLSNKAFQNVETLKDVQERAFAREMLSFTELSLAVPHQLEIVKSCQSTWLKRDAIERLAKSNTLEAAKGLVKIAEDEKDTSALKDIRKEIIEAIYHLRDNGDPNIINQTNKFVSEYSRRQ
jgi:hypothetical protein